MKFATKEQREQLRRDFPVGCRIVLDAMDDIQAPPIGTQGTCRGVDDAGDIMVSWDSGGSLKVAFGEDRCHRIATDSEFKVTLGHFGKSQHRGKRVGEKCPRCGRETVESNRLLALSRRADIMVCESCGMQEGVEDAGFIERKPLREWALLQLDAKSTEDCVTTICYGKKDQWKSRSEAEAFFLKAMFMSDGSEHQRYAKIYTELKMGLPICTDEEEG